MRADRVGTKWPTDDFDPEGTIPIVKKPRPWVWPRRPFWSQATVQNVNGLQEIEFSYPHDVVFAHLMRVLNRSRFKVQDHDDRMHWVYAYQPMMFASPATRTSILGARVKPKGNDASVLIIETGPSIEGGFPRDPEFHKRSVRGLIRKLQKSLKGQAASQ